MRLVVPLLFVAALLSGCGDDTVPVPSGVMFQVEQTRYDLQGRRFQLQVVNGGRQEMTVERVDFESGRLDEPATYDGPTPIAAGTTGNLTMTMPQARCGTGIDARVRIRHARGGGETVTSVQTPGDHYDSVARFMKRDCAERALGRLDIDDSLTVTGTGDESTLGIGMTITPPESGEPVHLVGVGGSTLLAPAARGAATIDHDQRPGASPLRTEVTFVPNRCDVHVVAEDRTGGVLPLEVESSAFGTSRVYLRFDERQKAQIFEYIADYCGFGQAQDR